MKARELRLMAIALGGLALVVAARGGEEGGRGSVTVDRSDADAVVSDQGGGGVSSFTDQVRDLVGSGSVRLLDFTEIDQPGDVCDEAVAGAAPRVITVSGGMSGVIDQDRFTELVVDRDVSYGDLDGDGSDEAVVHAVCNYGANGVQDSIQVWDLDAGTAQRTATLDAAPPSIAEPLPPTVQDVAVEDGDVVVTWSQYQEDDPRCCPSLQAQARYALADEDLTLTGEPETAPTR